jgi:hypothetical protein
MVAVTQITQYLYQSDPQKSVVRLTLYHYLKNASDISATFDTYVLDGFFDTCMLFQFWRERAASFNSEMKLILKEFSDKGLPISASVSSWEAPKQVVAIADAREQNSVLARYLNQHSKSETHRFVEQDNDRWLALSLLPTGGLRVRVFSNFARIQHGHLIPLNPQTDLEYTSYMELMPGRLQRLEIENGFRSALFHIEEGVYTGRWVQGPHFQNAGTLQTREIGSLQEMFYVLKSLEKHFIDPKSDPFYQELIDQLEKAYHMLSSHHPQGFEVGRPLLKKGQVALRNIYQKDKLLLLLVHNIEYMLNQESVHERGNPLWQNPRPLPR